MLLFFLQVRLAFVIMHWCKIENRRIKKLFILLSNHIHYYYKNLRNIVTSRPASAWIAGCRR